MTKREAAAADNEARARTEADVAFVEALARVLRDNDLAELEVTREYGEDDELTVRLSRVAQSAPAPIAAVQAVPAPALAPTHALAAPTAAPDAADPAAHPGCVTSPMVGTVYLAPEPGAANFIAVGDRVEAGATLLIIEAMKTMNQIPSPKAGVVREILVSNEQPVEFGAALVVIE